MKDSGLEIADGEANAQAGKVRAAGWDACAALPDGRAVGDPKPQACALTAWGPELLDLGCVACVGIFEQIL